MKKLLNFTEMTSKVYIEVALSLVGIIFLILGLIVFVPSGTKVKVFNERTTLEKPKEYIVNRKNTDENIHDVLANNNLPTNDEYKYSENLDNSIESIKEIIISRKIEVNLVEDGISKTVISGTQTVGDFILEQGIDIKKDDELFPPYQTQLTKENNEIIVNHTDVITETYDEYIPCESQLRPDENFDIGTRQTLQYGVSGIKRITAEIHYKGGVEVDSNILSEEILQQPIPEIIVYGTREIPIPESNVINSEIKNTTRDENGNIDTSSNESFARLVDSAHPLPLNYEPSDLVSMNYGNSRLRADAAFAFNMMKEHAQQDLGVVLLPISCYRSASTQSGLSGGGTAAAGYSEHQTGLAVDLGIEGFTGISSSEHFENTDTYKWLRENAQNYGFILSMPENTYWVKFEPWHWRFVGIDLAKDIWTAQRNGECIQMADYFNK